MQWWRSRRLKNWLGSVIILLAAFTLLRLIFLVFFSGLWGSDVVSSAQLWKSFWIGFAFDTRLALLVALLPLLLSVLPKFNSLSNRWIRLFSWMCLSLSILLIITIYFLDFGHYNYLGVRVNANVSRFFENADISWWMMWQSYPLLKIMVTWLIVCGLILGGLYWWESRQFKQQSAELSIFSVSVAVCISTGLFVFGFLGRFEHINWANPVPLRWNDSFYDQNQALGEFGLNPVLFLVDTLRIHSLDYNEIKVREYYPMIAKYLGVEDRDSNQLAFSRQVDTGLDDVSARPPNVIFIMLESLGASRVSAYGNPIPTTPNLDSILEDGWWMRNFYVPVTGTAKTVWASITGVPDVTRKDGATRIPFIARQKTLINAFVGYRKLYMIGGSAAWANMSALIRQSIDNVELYDESHWSSPVVDVWGISDLSLFQEGGQLLRQANEEGPFFAYIQTAGNHRPFTIPTSNRTFESLEVSEEQYTMYGFRSSEQMNGVHLLDYNIGEFMKMAKEGGYFDNTIFVLFGDHNNRITHLPHMPPAYEELGLESNHVPAVIYAPNLLQPKRIDDAVGLADLLPTVLGLTGHSYHNNTLGRDVRQPVEEFQRSVPLVLVEGAFPIIGAVSREFLVRMNYDGSSATLHRLDVSEPQDNIADEYPEIFNELYNIAYGTYETARMMLQTNSIQG